MYTNFCPKNNISWSTVSNDNVTPKLNLIIWSKLQNDGKSEQIRNGMLNWHYCRILRTLLYFILLYLIKLSKEDNLSFFSWNEGSHFTPCPCYTAPYSTVFYKCFIPFCIFCILNAFPYLNEYCFPFFIFTTNCTAKKAGIISDSNKK